MSKQVHLSKLSTKDYQPFVYEGKTVGEVHWLRDTAAGQGVLFAGLWKCGPTTFDYTFPGDETMQVLEGELNIKMANGETVTLKSGDIASFAKGLKSTWTITSPFHKFFVISG
jgi:uncharacterized cupin superfamily protein